METVKDALKLKCKREYLIEMLKDKYNKNVTPKDLKNLSMKLKPDSNDEIKEVIEFLQNKGSLIIIVIMVIIIIIIITNNWCYYNCF